MSSKKRKETGDASPEPSASPTFESTDTGTPTFESALNELESIVRQLERDDLTLDSALACFERGIYLMRTCDACLNQARGRITELIRGDNGKFVEKVLGTTLESFLKEAKNND